MSDFHFDQETHTYTLDGARLPSVTQVVRASFPGWSADAYYLQKGSALHHGCRLLDERRLNWNSVAPEIAGKVKAWQKFRNDFPCNDVLVEKPLAHEMLRFAGTPDRVLAHNGNLIIADLKSSIEPAVRLQLSGYSILWSQNHRVQPKAMMAVAVELREDETYRTLWLDRPQLRRAEQVFLAALTVYGFRAEHKLKGPQE